MLSHSDKDKNEDDSTNVACFRFDVAGASKRSGLELAAFEGEADADGGYTHVFSRSLEFEPHGKQDEEQPEGGPVHGDILIAKLAPGQVIKCEMRARKGVGKDHAKFSPVATASYRLATNVVLSKDAPFYDAEADALAACCPMGVFDIEEIGAGGGAAGGGKTKSGGGGGGGEAQKAKRVAVAKRPRDCTVCRECLRPPSNAGRVTLDRLSTHFIFSVESTGALPARELVRQAMRVLAQKAKAVDDFMGANEAAIPVISAAKAKPYTESGMKEAVDEES